MGELRIGQGRDAARQYLKDNPEVAEQLEEDIRANAYKLQPSQGKAAAKAAAQAAAPAAVPAAAPAARAAASRAVDVSAEDFEDADQ